MIDRLGRRTFMLIGTGGLTVALVLEAVMQAEYLGTDNVAGQRAAIFFIFLFIFFWSTFIDASQYLYVSEIFPTHLRAQGMAVSMVGLYSGSIILLCAGPIALNVIKWKFFLCLIIPNSLHWLIIFFFYPETKQRSLEDINEAFGEKVAVHYYHATIEDEQKYASAFGGEKVDEDRKGDDSPDYQHAEAVEKV